MSLLPLPGLVSPDVALDDDGFLFEELEVPPAQEASYVPLDGDGSPGLGAAPLLLQLLVQKLLEEHLPQIHTHTHIKTCWHAQSKSVSQTGHGGTLVSPSWYCPSSVQNMSSRATVCSLSDATGRRWVSSTPYLEHNTFFNLVFIQICVNFQRWMNLSWWKLSSVFRLFLRMSDLR